MKNKISQNGCHNCKNLFLKLEYDESEEYFCNIKKNRPPKCGSVYMKESFFVFSKKKDKFYEKNESLYSKWSEWSESNKVNPWDICDKWRKKD